MNEVIDLLRSHRTIRRFTAQALDDGLVTEIVRCGQSAPTSSNIQATTVIHVRDPWSSKKNVAEVFLKDMSLSTSGSYEKFFRAEGHIYAHIMDPRTGFPAQGSVSVSVLAPRTLDSEVWAKPYFINGRQWAEGHKPKEFRVLFCEDRTDHTCAWLP